MEFLVPAALRTEHVELRSIAQFEENVLYPAMLLIGRCVRLNLDE